ncbi:MAG: hypothetical protein WCT27_01895 [Patescibacteria group bacterium]
MGKAAVNKPDPAVVNGWQRFQRTVLHRQGQGGISPPAAPVTQMVVDQQPIAPVETKPVVPTTPQVHEPAGPFTLNIGNVGHVISQIIGLYRCLGSWRIVAHRFDVTLSDFRQWVIAHQADFVGHSAELVSLIKPEPIPRRKWKTPESGDRQPAVPIISNGPERVGALTVSPDVLRQIEAYCSSHGLTHEQVFRRIIDFATKDAEAEKIGIADGVFELLVKQHGGLIVGPTVYRAVEAYCQHRGTTMEQLFGEHDTRRTATVARDVGISPVIFTLMVKFFKGPVVPAA